MYNHYSIGKILLQTSTNGSCWFPRHFPTEYEWFISWIQIYLCVHIWPFYLNKGDWIDNVHKLELMINKLKGKGSKCSIEKSFFGQTKMEYLGLWVTRDGVKPISKKI